MNLYNFTKQCVLNYSQYKIEEGYILSVKSLPDFVQDEFAALIISDEPSFAYEASSLDNPEWNNKMFPALLSYLMNSTDKDKSIQFTNTWRESITSYMHNKMQELIDEVLEDMNIVGGFLKTYQEAYGIPARGTI